MKPKLKRPASLAAAHGSASRLLKKQIARLATHRQMWAASRGNMATLPSDGQCRMIIGDLEKALAIIAWPQCSYCGVGMARGGNRQGCALCQNCYEAE